MEPIALDKDISDAEKELLSRVGYKPDAERAGTYVLVDHDTKHTSVTDPNVEVMPIKEALQLYPWVQDLMFGLIAPDENAHVKQAAERMHDPIGHFIRVREGAKVRLPVQSFSLLEMPQGRQFTHSVTVIESGAEVEMISGSAVPRNVHAGHHISIDETYVRPGAVCRSLSIEQWGPDMEIHSYSRCRVEEGAQTSGRQIQMTPIRHHVCESKTYLGKDARSNDEDIVFAPDGTTRIIHSETHLDGPGAKSESLARMVTAGGSITNKSTLVGNAPDTKGFLGCDGLKLSDDGEILSIPGLLARNAQSQLSHEASVGMISAEKMAYLMASGLTEDAARDLIIQGFLHLGEQDLPEAIKASVQEMIAAAKSGAM